MGRGLGLIALGVALSAAGPAIAYPMFAFSVSPSTFMTGTSGTIHLDATIHNTGTTTFIQWGAEEYAAGTLKAFQTSPTMVDFAEVMLSCRLTSDHPLALDLRFTYMFDDVIYTGASPATTYTEFAFGGAQLYIVDTRRAVGVDVLSSSG